MSRARTLLDRMLAVKGSRTVANTLAPYDELLDELNTASGQVTVMMDLPGGCRVQLYEPRHPIAIGRN